MFANHMSDKELISKIYKNSQNSVVNKQTNKNNPIKKMGRRPE